MKKTLTLAAAALMALTLPNVSVARDLTIVGFGGGYQDSAREHLFEGYEAASGTAVSDDVYNGEMAKLYGMVETGNVTYDIIMVEAPELVRGCEDGIFAPIDYEVVDGSKFIEGATHECGVGGTGWGAAMFFDKAKHPNGPTTYAEFWDVEAFPGVRALRTGPKMTLEAALMADGVAKADVYDVLATDEGVERAFAKLDEIKDHLVWWKSGAQPLQLVGSGEVDYAFAYTGRIIRANGEGADYQLNWSTLLYSIDYWAVVSGSPMMDEAMKMVEWITSPEPLRAQAAVWPISPANAEVNADPALQAANPGMVLNHSDEGLFISTEFWIAHGDELQAKFTSWAAQ
ncbi:ABC transporter substrate-binding protein [Roseovarius sp. ZX-A-9]|uniref:ABC transporter substrate-binding protein n=1 Tax=Roseovarius sp. ZX-A-9 TaxID=3014783 RepID=UPI00232B2C9B|nr:ABC transporter substrate-binding protein [Roseovarius sp. ZX-A-9]MDX1784578.1 ABC transporter substrate-binding protein [Roseovarius sp.]